MVLGAGLPGVVPLAGVDLGERGGKSKTVEGTFTSRTDGGVREKVNFGGSISFEVKVRDLLSLTVDLTEVRFGNSKGIGAVDGLWADLRESLFLRGRFKGEDATEEKEGELPGEYLLRLGVSLSLGLDAGRLGVDNWIGTGP